MTRQSIPLTRLNPDLTAKYPPFGRVGAPQIGEAGSADVVVIDGRPTARWRYQRLEQATTPWIAEDAISGHQEWFGTLRAARVWTHQCDAEAAPPPEGAMYLRLATLLTLSTGRLLAYDMADLHLALEHLVGAPVIAGAFSEIPAAIRAVTPHVLAQHPWLAGLSMPSELGDKAEWIRAWLFRMERTRGYAHPVLPVPAGTWTPGAAAAEILAAARHGVVPFVVVT